MRISKINLPTFANAWTPPSRIRRFFSPDDAFYGAHGWGNSPPDTTCSAHCQHDRHRHHSH